MIQDNHNQRQRLNVSGDAAPSLPVPGPSAWTPRWQHPSSRPRGYQQGSSQQPMHGPCRGLNLRSSRAHQATSVSHYGACWYGISRGTALGCIGSPSLQCSRICPCPRPWTRLQDCRQGSSQRPRRVPCQGWNLRDGSGVERGVRTQDCQRCSDEQSCARLANKRATQRLKHPLFQPACLKEMVGGVQISISSDNARSSTLPCCLP